MLRKFLRKWLKYRIVGFKLDRKESDYMIKRDNEKLLMGSFSGIEELLELGFLREWVIKRKEVKLWRNFSCR